MSGNDTKRQWFRVVNMAAVGDGVRARLDIYDQIGEYLDWVSWEAAGVTGSDFSAALQALVGVTEIELHINSPGGSVTEGWVIFNELKRHPAKVIAYVDGQAASMASVILQAADERVMPANTTQWIHNPVGWFDGYVHGNSDDMRKVAEQALHLADDLDTIGEQIINVYIGRAEGKLSDADVRSMMGAETLLSAEECVEYGFADRLEEEIQIAACKDAAAAQRSAVASAKRVVDEAIAAARDADAGAGAGAGAGAVDQDAAAGGDDASLAGVLGALISAQAPGEDERVELIADMASAAGMEPGEVQQVLDGAVECQQVERLQAFADTLDGAQLVDLMAAAGCAPGPGVPCPAGTPADADRQAVPVAQASATDIITACKAAGFPSLCVDMIEARVPMAEVSARLAMAGEIRDMMAAAGLEAQTDGMIAAAAGGTLDAIRHVVAMRLEQDAPDIRAEHGAGDGAGMPANVIDIKAVYAAANKHKVINR